MQRCYQRQKSEPSFPDSACESECTPLLLKLSSSSLLTEKYSIRHTNRSTDKKEQEATVMEAQAK